MPEVGTVYCGEGKTKIVPYEDRFAPSLKIAFFDERWVKDGKHRAYIAVVKYRDHEVKISDYWLSNVLRRLGHVLLALTEPVEQ